MATDPDGVSDAQRHQSGSGPPTSEMSMMRIAVAGTGGLARLIAHFIDHETSHHVVLLSRGVRHPLLLTPLRRCDVEGSLSVGLFAALPQPG